MYYFAMDNIYVPEVSHKASSNVASIEVLTSLNGINKFIVVAILFVIILPLCIFLQFECYNFE